MSEDEEFKTLCEQKFIEFCRTLPLEDGKYILTGTYREDGTFEFSRKKFVKEKIKKQSWWRKMFKRGN